MYLKDSIYHPEEKVTCSNKILIVPTNMIAFRLHLSFL